MYGRDPHLPTPAVLSLKQSRTIIDLKEYGTDIHVKMTGAWELARQSIGRAQKKQKDMYDKRVTGLTFREGERVFLYKPVDKTGEARKFARPFHGPYRVTELGSNTAKIRRVDKPDEESILVSLDRLRRCPQEIGTEFWTPDRGWRKKTTHVAGREVNTDDQPEPVNATSDTRSKKWARTAPQWSRNSQPPNRTGYSHS